ncbi:MAG TPA: SIR2 family protein [Pyrinomonadaceae bacterium]|nr:SIR2 family protein [Pyrinomonadaceae bacterium]
MPVELYPKEALVNAALMTKRPVAFLVGSPLSLKDGNGVPGITTMLDFVRAEILDRASFTLPQFERELDGKSGADAYQAAMKWLGVNAGQDAINEVIAKAVLQARKPTAGACPAGSDGQPEDWNIPPGTTGLAELVTRGGDRFLGPILTTNFDPLISLGIRQSGGRASRRVLTADGSLGGSAEDEPGVYSVIHLHGFWRVSETLHTQKQLTNPRPKLKASLQHLLVAQRRTLIVAAYGGWDDVFTQALVELMNDEQAQLDVIWCFYESDPGEVEQRYGKLLQAMNSAIVLNRFRPFGGIDAHSIFSEILSTLQGMSSPAVVASSVSSPLAGWEHIDSAYLNSLPALSPGEIVRYFDGAVPTWPHAVSAAIPRRQAVDEVTKNLAKVAKDDTARSMHLIRAAGGEGKSTVLLQAAADIARAGGWSVLWRSSPKEGISPEQVGKLDTTRRWLIVADDADNIVRGLADSANHLSHLRRGGVHFLLAARDVDWRNAHGQQEPWAEWLTYFPDIILRGVSPKDARAVVTAWQQLESDGGLGALISIRDTAQRIAAFESAVSEAENTQAEQQKKRQTEQQKKRRPQDGSFFGGLLAVRFGQSGLQAHVRDFLRRLKEVRIEYGSASLFDALLYVAACHGTDIPGIDERVLADLVGVPREWVQRQVVRPLGDEAAAVYNAEHVLTRHSRVAAAILIEAEQTFDIPLTEIWTKLVLQTVLIKRDIPSRNWFSEVVHAGPRLQRALPQQLSNDRRKAIAIAAAKASIAAGRERLSYVTDLGKTYRSAEMIEQAVETFRDNLKDAASKVDFDSDIRGYWSEWAVCEGLADDIALHRAADAWLQGLSLSDHLNPAPITPDRVRLSCAGLGFAFGKLARPTPDCLFAKGRRAATFLGRRFGYDPRSYYIFDRHDRKADNFNTPYPRDVPEALAWLTAGVAQAGRELQDPFLKALLEPEKVSFNLLQTALKPDSAPKSLGSQSSKPNAPLGAPPSDTKLPQLSIQGEDQIRAGIERVVNEAWKAVPPDTAPENRLQLAIQKAKQSISRLSPHIKRQVGAHFQTKEWEPLKSREPKP